MDKEILVMLKLFVFACLAVLTVTNFAFSQTMEESKISDIRLSLSAGETLWQSGKPMPIKVIIENITEDLNSLVLPSRISFIVSDGTRETRITMSDKVFWSPVSLTKTYDEKINACQNDLTKKRVNTSGSTSPPSKDFVLGKSEKKEFNFNLAGMCWNHVISSVYPNRDLFSLAKPGKYRVYFEMAFNAGNRDFNGVKIPLVKKLKSNDIEITIN